MFYSILFKIWNCFLYAIFNNHYRCFSESICFTDGKQITINRKESIKNTSLHFNRGRNAENSRKLQTPW